MIEGVLRHCTEMAVDRNYVNTHDQLEVAFAMCSLLGFRLLPSLKGINRQKSPKRYVHRVQRESLFGDLPGYLQSAAHISQADIRSGAAHWDDIGVFPLRSQRLIYHLQRDGDSGTSAARCPGG